MHHPVSGINSLIHSVSLASHVSTHLLIHLSAHLYCHHHSHHPSLLNSFAPGSKPIFSTNPFHVRLLLPTGLPSWQRDGTGPIMLIVLFLVSYFNFLFVPCGGLSWLPISFLLHVKYTLSYRIVSLVRHIPVLHFPPLWLGPLFYGPAFSAFPPIFLTITEPLLILYTLMIDRFI